MFVFFKQSQWIPFFITFLKLWHLLLQKHKRSPDLLFVIFIYAFLCTENKKVIKTFKLQSIFLPYTQLWKTD